MHGQPLFCKFHLAKQHQPEPKAGPMANGSTATRMLAFNLIDPVNGFWDAKCFFQGKKEHLSTCQWLFYFFDLFDESHSTRDRSSHSATQQLGHFGSTAAPVTQPLSSLATLAARLHQSLSHARPPPPTLTPPPNIFLICVCAAAGTTVKSYKSGFWK